MAVELQNLCSKILSQYDVKMHTKGYFRKMIVWIHMVEDVDFVPLLHGDELVFNSGLNYTSDEWLRGYIEAINEKQAGGLIIALRDGHNIPQEIIDYCNQIRFPLFSATWKTPYIDIMRLFSLKLLENEQRDTNLGAALKNAIFSPDNEELYLSHFERNGFFQDMKYYVIILSCNAYNTEEGNEELKQIEKSLRYSMKRGIFYEESGRLIILAAEYPMEKIFKEFQKICEKDSNIYVGIGTEAGCIKDIHKSYRNAYTAYQLTKTTIQKNILSYEELGVYKILSDVKETGIYPEYIQEILGKLIEYDENNSTDYVRILEAYFDNECSIVHTAQALFCHKNTLAYKINKIKEILGYDILLNENRMKIMLSFYIMRLGTGYF